MGWSLLSIEGFGDGAVAGRKKGTSGSVNVVIRCVRGEGGGLGSGWIGRKRSGDCNVKLARKVRYSTGSAEARTGFMDRMMID